MSDFDEVLSTTRAVRRRLDLNRPVARALLLQCVELAMQAPTERNWQRWRFLFVTDAAQRARLADLYRRGVDGAADETPPAYGVDRSGSAVAERIGSSSETLYRRIHQVPVLLVPCVRVDPNGGSDHVDQANTWASVLPAVWSFMLAARSRGLGTVFTTPHLRHEQAAAEILGIPDHGVRQAGLVPVGHTVGQHFTPARTPDVPSVAQWNRWHDRPDLEGDAS